jgi:hypothetical protein
MMRVRSRGWGAGKQMGGVASYGGCRLLVRLPTYLGRQMPGFVVTRRGGQTRKVNPKLKAPIRTQATS